jgi:MATE family multidrug resistance protein
LEYYLEVGISSLMGLVLDWSAFEVILIISGYIGIIPLATNVIFVNIAEVLYEIPYGIGIAAAAYVGGSIGKKDPVLSKKTAKASLIVGVGIQFLVLSPMVLFPDSLASLFTQDPIVIAKFVECSLVLNISLMFDGLNATLMGVIKGMGKQKIATLAPFLGHYMVGFPIGIYLCFQ